MRQLKNILLIVTACLSAVMTSSCDNTSPTETIAVSDIVLIKSTDTDGTIFQMQLPQSSEIITMTSPTPLDTAVVKPGQCIYLRYIPQSGKPYMSGPIDIVSYSPLTNIDATLINKTQLNDWDSSPVYLMSCRTMLGRVIIYGGLAYPVEKRRLTIAIDPQSVNGHSAEAWLVHEVKPTPETYLANFHVVFNTSDLIKLMGVENLTLNVNNSNLDENKINLNFK